MMIEWLANKAYTSYAWLINANGEPVTGATADLICKVLDEAENVHATPSITEVDSTNTPGLYKASFTPDNTGIFKTHWKSNSTNATVVGGEILKVLGHKVETATFSYPGSDATEKVVTELFTTVWSTYYTKFREHRAIYFDINPIMSDGNNPNLTIREKVRVDGTNWREISTVTINTGTSTKAWAPSEMRKLGVGYQITMQTSVGMTGAKTVPYHFDVVLEDL